MMKKTSILLRLALLMVLLTAGNGRAWAQTTTVLTENFSGATNIFGVTATGLAEGSATIYDSGLTGFDKVLAVCKATAEATVKGTDGRAVDFSASTLTAEWDAFHGWLGSELTTKVALVNSDGQELASYTYNCNKCQITDVTIGGNTVAAFQPFALQSKYQASQGANGWQGGSKGQKYVATAGWNPHVAISMTALGGVEMNFTLNGTTTTMLGSLGTLKKDVAKMTIVSNVNNTDRCYAIDNIKVSTEPFELDPDYVEGIANITITGADKMTFGPSTAEAFSNPYTVTIVGTDGTTITENNLNKKVTDFKVVWDIEGFKTQNDTQGQYCDSYGAFAVNNAGQVATTFDLRDVPMNFFGKMTATVTYNGKTVKAEKYVVALGNLSKGANQILPLAGYPAELNDYPAALNGYKITGETYGNGNDLIIGGWCVAGSDSHNGVLQTDADGTKFVRLTAATAKKSHVMTQKIESPSGQIIFENRLRFNSAGAVVTLTSGYPFWSSASSYSCPITLTFDGSKIKLNGKTLANGDNDAVFTTATWYDVVLSADKSSECCYAMVYDTKGNLLAQSGVVAWAETSSPTFFSIGMGNNNTGSVDFATYEAFLPTAMTDSYTLTADKTTLSIPNKESATLTATLTDQNGYAITGQATWTVVEEDMQQSIIITPDATDSHKATVTLTETAEAGTATIQVSIGGSTKTIELSLTSSAESVKFTQSTTSITIPMDADATATATFAAIIIDGDGNDIHSTVTLAAYDKDNTVPVGSPDGAIHFDAATGVLTVKATASPTVLTIRATGLNSKNETLTKAVKVNIHGMKFDFGPTDDAAIAEGFTPVGPSTAYSATNGYGIKSGTAVAATVGGGSPATATNDYLQGAIEFDFKVTKGDFYTVEITYQGILTTGYINSDLAGYELGNHTSLSTDTYTIPATVDIVDLHIANADATHVAQIAQVTITKEPKRQKRGKRVVHHIGDSTSANSGSWAYRLAGMSTTYPELFSLCAFQNNGRGGRNLSTYYMQGHLYNVLRDIYPDDIVMLGNNGTNGMGNSFEADMNYYLDAAEALGAKVIINSYTPHGAVSNYAGGYNSTTATFSSYRKDSYETIVRKVAQQRENNDDNYLGFVEIGRNADAIFNAYAKDYAANGYANANAAAQAIITCFTDHNHYSNGTLACDLMLNGYKTTDAKGIVQQLVDILKSETTAIAGTVGGGSPATASEALYSLSGQRVNGTPRPGIYVKDGRKIVIK